MPPRLFSLGIPPANNPPNCGASGKALAPPPVSLPLLALLLPGTAGAAPPGGFNVPGTGGALGAAGPEDVLDPSIMGADRSFVTAFFNWAPLLMSPRSAPYWIVSHGQ
jgi:hypothetical protein